MSWPREIILALRDKGTITCTWEYRSDLYSLTKTPFLISNEHDPALVHFGSVLTRSKYLAKDMSSFCNLAKSS